MERVLSLLPFFPSNFTLQKYPMFVNIEAKPITFNKNLSFPTRRSKLKKIVRLSSEGAYVELTYLLAEIMESSSSSKLDK